MVSDAAFLEAMGLKQLVLVTAEMFRWDPDEYLFTCLLFYHFYSVQIASIQTHKDSQI